MYSYIESEKVVFSATASIFLISYQINLLGSSDIYFMKLSYLVISTL